MTNDFKNFQNLFMQYFETTKDEDDIKETWRSTPYLQNILLGTFDNIIKVQESDLIPIESPDELIKILDNEEIKYLTLKSEKRLNISYKNDDFKKYTLNFISLDKNYFYIKNYLKDKDEYLIECDGINLLAINLKVETADAFKKFTTDKKFTEVGLRYGDTKLKMTKRKLEKIFNYIPEVKKEYIKVVKDFVTRGRALIEMGMNNEFYKMTEEDTLMMEVIDD